MKKQLHILFAITTLLAAMLACANPLGEGGVTNVETAVAGTFSALTQPVVGEATTTPPPLTSSLLPLSLYFINNDNAGLAQVYRLDRDGKTVTQLTFEPANVEDYDISPIDGSVAYISNNQLFTINADGSNRSMIVDGGVKDENNPFVTNINNPVWSPDGQNIAFGYKGLNFYSIIDGQYTTVLENKTNNIDGGLVFPEELYFPEKYSPDGSKLLITLGYYEGASAAVYPLNGGPLVRLTGAEGALICCGYTEWTPDGSAFYAASPTFGMSSAGLWRVDAATGNVTTLLLGNFDTNPAHSASTPFLASDGQLYFFYTTVPNTGDFVNRAPLQLVRSGADGVTNRTVLRPETYEFMNEALWSPDGSFVIAAVAPNPDIYIGGELRLVPVDGQKSVISLVPFGTNIQWGP